MAPPKRDPNGNVVAWCERCNSTTTFERDHRGSEYGSLVWQRISLDQYTATWEMHRLVRCSGCGRGAVAELHNPDAANEDRWDTTVALLSPSSVETVMLPADAPPPIVAEFREAERCASAGAFRGGSALLRSALEKTLNANGYTKVKLYLKIEQAAQDGVLTDARRRQAHDNVRSLGNDVAHEGWRAVSTEEFELAQRYTQRVIEDLYESRDAVVAILTEKGRLQAASPPDEDPPSELDE